MHICWLADIRIILASLFRIRRERMHASKPCPPDCCGHGHIYCYTSVGRPRDEKPWVSNVRYGWARLFRKEDS